MKVIDPKSLEGRVITAIREAEADGEVDDTTGFVKASVIYRRVNETRAAEGLPTYADNTIKNARLRLDFAEITITAHGRTSIIEEKYQ